MTWYRDYQGLMNGCIVFYDGTLTSDGKMANLVDTFKNGVITNRTYVANHFGIAKSMVWGPSGEIAYASRKGISTGIAINTVPWTIIFKYKPTTTVGGYIGGSYAGTASICAYASGGVWLRNSSNVAVSVSPTLSVPNDGNYHTSIISHSGSVMSAYMDGANKGTTTTSVYMNDGTYVFEIGGQPYPNPATLWEQSSSVNFDAFLWFNRVLSDGEVAALHRLLMTKSLSVFIPNAEGRLIC